MPKFLVEEISTFRIRYVVEAECAEHAGDSVVCKDDDFQEFSQLHLGEVISDIREITDEEYLKQFDKDNNYLKSWTDKEKFKLVNHVKD